MDGVSREDYLNNQDVGQFIDWLEQRLDLPIGFRHTCYLVKARKPWGCACLYQAFENYWWPFNFVCPIQQRRIYGNTSQDSFTYMKFLTDSFRNAIASKNADNAYGSAVAMLTWGGVTARNRDLIADMGSGICGYFQRAQTILNLNNTRLGHHPGVYINAGFTKLYSLLVDDFVMYDGRVGAALGLLGRLYAEEAGLNRIPVAIEFSFGTGKTSSGYHPLGANRRNPSTEKYKLPEFSGKPNRHLNDNIKASWLLKALADQTGSRFSNLPQASPLNERLTAIQSALFMIGYDVTN